MRAARAAGASQGGRFRRAIRQGAWRSGCADRGGDGVANHESAGIRGG